MSLKSCFTFYINKLEKDIFTRQKATVIAETIALWFYCTVRAKSNGLGAGGSSPSYLTLSSNVILIIGAIENYQLILPKRNYRKNN